jgi:hypothetical protein
VERGCVGAEHGGELKVRGRRKTEELRWRDGERLLLPVVRVPIEATVLNPRSHRIRARLEAKGAAAEIVGSDPFSEDAQTLIADILRETPGYEEIKGALGRDKQRHPGVLTHKGLLVNANTRQVALVALGIRYIDVVVLPADALEPDIVDLELELQMEEDVKQEYEFTARMLFIEELMARRNMSAEDVGFRLERSLATDAKGRQRARDLVEQEMRMLRVVRELVDLSGGSIKLTDFDNARQALIEIDQDYERLRRSNPAQALRVRDAQLVGQLVGVDYRRLRDVDTSFIDNYLPVSLAEQMALSGYVADLLTAVDPSGPGQPGLAGLDVLEFGDDFESPNSLVNPRRLLELLAPENGEIVLRDENGSAHALSKDSVVAGVSTAFSTAVESKRRDSKAVDRLDAPMIHVSDARAALDRARSAWQEVKGTAGFDDASFDARMRELVRAFDNLRNLWTPPST